MAEQRSEWQTRELSTLFLEGIRGAIPGADLQLEVIGKIVQVWRPRVSTVLDLGCGDGILGRFLMDHLPDAHALFVDFSDPMLEAARKKLGHATNASVVKADFSEADWTRAVADRAPFDVVVSGFAIHHLPDDRKKELYTEVFGLLSAGGVFLNLEHVASLTPAAAHVFDEYFVDNLQRFATSFTPEKSRDDVAKAYYTRRDKKENILAPTDTQCEWLRQIGFEDVDCFFKLLELALFGGRKPVAAPEPTGLT